jgi:predicted NAD-dependent protein-ADP-ribosyltransferase YbiA (DUF1768 family)
MIDPNQDGITHINIYSQGKTDLGKMLSNFYKCLIITRDGKFNSVEGYWYWLGIEECEEKEVLRTLSGYQAKKIGNELKKKYQQRVDSEFEDKIIRAIWAKVKTKVHMFKSEIVTLPFEHYYNYGGKVVDVKDKYPWMMEAIDKMRNYIIRTENKVHD